MKHKNKHTSCPSSSKPAMRTVPPETYEDFMHASDLILRIAMTVFGTFIILFALACAYLKRAEPYPCRLFLWAALSGVFTVVIGQIVTRISFNNEKKSDR